MQFGSNINTLMQQVMAMKSPELINVLPTIEAQPYDDRVCTVQRGKANLDAVIKNWDKFSDVLEARGMSKSEVKRKGKDLKAVRGKLEMALRLADPKIIPAPFKTQAESAFNVVAAWFEMNKDYMESVYAAPKLTRQTISSIILPPVERLQPESADADTIIREDYFMSQPFGSRSCSDDDVIDIMDKTGNSHLH